MCRGSEDNSLRASPEHPTSPRLSVGKEQSGEGERERERERERESEENACTCTCVFYLFSCTVNVR